MVRHPIHCVGLRIPVLSPLLLILLIASGAATAAVAPQPGDFQSCSEQGQGGGSCTLILRINATDLSRAICRG